MRASSLRVRIDATTACESASTVVVGVAVLLLTLTLQKIEAALRRIDDGSYGYCVETDEPINLRRLEARPIASLSLHAQEQHERMERIHRDD